MAWSIAFVCETKCVMGSLFRHESSKREKSVDHLRLGCLFVLYGEAFKVFSVSVCPEFLEFLTSSLGGTSISELLVEGHGRSSRVSDGRCPWMLVIVPFPMWGHSSLSAKAFFLFGYRLCDSIN